MTVSKRIVWFLYLRSARRMKVKKRFSIKWWGRRTITGDGSFLFWRLYPFGNDEFIGSDGVHHYRAPWYAPFYVMLHWWRPEPGTTEAFHDHPRWSVTVLLRGELIEKTPWGQRVLRPGSIVIRSRYAIHAFECTKPGTTWTLFIAGRRNHQQHVFTVKDMPL